MIQGTASSVGKSLLVAALCRIFRDEGVRVAPFKSQNMALNSYVTRDGREIGRAQVVQAEAARIEPTVEMNPILLKPEPGLRSQVVLLGKPIGSMPWSDYCAIMPSLHDTIHDCLETLRANYELLIIEGAGSPVEINLRHSDIVNMHVAEVAEAPVVLVGDIDKGGVFAQIVGTMELLAPGERERIAGFLINKFRGEVALLKPGLEFIEERFKVPVLGVVPWIDRLRIAEEDSVALQSKIARPRSSSELDIAVVKLPAISNYDDFMPLEHQDGMQVRFVDRVENLAGADLVIIPGTKSTVSDLKWMQREGFANEILARANRGEPVLGICGGCQMLGDAIEDPHAIESPDPLVRGLGLLPLRTIFQNEKVTARVVALPRSSWFQNDAATTEITGYEIHMGIIERTDASRPAFTLISRNGANLKHPDGAVSENGNVVGTMLHGIFENASVREALLNELRMRKRIPAPVQSTVVTDRDAEYDRLARAVRASIDLEAIRRIIGI